MWNEFLKMRCESLFWQKRKLFWVNKVNEWETLTVTRFWNLSFRVWFKSCTPHESNQIEFFWPWFKSRWRLESNQKKYAHYRLFFPSVIRIIHKHTLICDSNHDHLFDENIEIKWEKSYEMLIMKFILMKWEINEV